MELLSVMRIFKVKKQGIIYKVYEAIRDFNGLIIDWEYVGETIYNFKAYGYVNQMGREYNPTIDRVMKTWDGIGTYMKRY